MAEHVEARSLASLNALAGNPPQYPTNPAEQRREPLTLYISRVPGTRDVILSTYKPHIKNVTAEDVASSLYYVHLNRPEHESPVSKAQGDNSSPRSSLESARSGSQIQRKPLPRDTNPLHVRSNDLDPTLASNTGPSRYDEGYGASRQLPIRQPDLSTQGSLASSPMPPMPPIHRKPLGPRNPAAGAHTNDEPPPYNPLPLPPRPELQPALPPRPVEQPALPPRPDEIPDYPYNPLAPPLPSPSRSPSPPKRRPFVPYSLTLIRRDPSSGQQWNVGRVASFQLEHPEQVPPEKERHLPSPSISISVETSGYAKFRGMSLAGLRNGSVDMRDIRESLDLIRPGNGRAQEVEARNINQSPQRAGRYSPDRGPGVQRAQLEAKQTLPATGIFERQVKMTYAPSFATNFKNAFRRRGSKDSEDLPGGPLSPRRPGHDRQISATSIGSLPDADFDIGDKPVFTMPASGLKRQGYAFVSPWDGRCEFRTGNGGRSLRCRHVLPTFGGWNPLVNREGDDSSHDKSNRDIREVSELRFNLPSGEVFGKDNPSQRQEGKERTRDRLKNAMINRTEDDIDDDEYESYGFDLNLGREKAGGGNRGKRAKMGKLIVFEEGLKMLDLVVAANVGVWWGVWERRLE